MDVTKPCAGMLVPITFGAACSTFGTMRWRPMLNALPRNENERSAQVAEEATPGTGFDLEMEQRRAYEVVNALLREIEGMTQP